MEHLEPKVADHSILISVFLRPEENPAFHNHSRVYLPYCSSDVYTGDREAGLLTQGFTFNGKHIFMAMMEDLIANTDILGASQVHHCPWRVTRWS